MGGEAIGQDSGGGAAEGGAEALVARLVAQKSVVNELVGGQAWKPVPPSVHRQRCQQET